MQDRYTGDAGDFGKYGLLKAICGFRAQDRPPQLSLGILWYLTPDESHNNDGRHTGYLKPTKSNIHDYLGCDPHLYEALGNIVQSNNRSVAAIRESAVFNPELTSYFEERLDYSNVQAPKGELHNARLEYRQNWLTRARRALAKKQVIFFDPDKSLEPRNTPATQPTGHRYAYIKDLQLFLNHKPRTLVVYHHLDRSAPAQQQVAAKLHQVAAALKTNPTALVYHRGSARAFIVIPAPEHRDLITRRLHDFTASNWSKHFDLYELQPQL